MKIVAISDTHTKHKKLRHVGGIPECDVLVHAGDFSWTGKFWEVRNFLDWFIKQPAKHKIIIAGNHEEPLDVTHPKHDATIASLPKLPAYREHGVHYLENSSIVIDGVKFYGTPWTPWFHDWGFNGIEGSDAPFRRHEGRMLVDVYGDIPADTNVLICHGPPYDILDMASRDDRCGSVEMRKLLESDKLAQLKLYLCGHIHEARGHDMACGGVNFCNVSSLGADYETVLPPVVIELDEDGFVDKVTGYDNETIQG